MKNTIIYQNHILNRCIKIERITSSVSESEFMSDKDAQDIIIRSLEIIGEATTHLSDEFKSKYSEIPWRKIKMTPEIKEEAEKTYQRSIELYGIKSKGKMPSAKKLSE